MLLLLFNITINVREPLYKRKIQSIFQLTKNQMNGQEHAGWNSYELWNTSKVQRWSKLGRVKSSFETL